MIGDFVLAAVLLGGGLALLLIKSARKDGADAQAKAARVRAEEAAAREDARKFEEGTALVCLGCETQFRGPLTEQGCPRCHLSSLVMTETQFQKIKASGESTG